MQELQPNSFLFVPADFDPHCSSLENQMLVSATCTNKLFAYINEHNTDGKYNSYLIYPVLVNTKFLVSNEIILLPKIKGMECRIVGRQSSLENFMANAIT